MCRYATPYKLHFVCFDCRKMFRQPPRHELVVPLAEGQQRVAPCPQCGQPMHDLGLDFKAPRQRDVDQWEKVRHLHAHGVRFSSCGCSGPGPRPRRLREVPAFLEAMLPQSPGERLLRRLNASAPNFRAGKLPPGVGAGEHPLSGALHELWRHVYRTGRGSRELRLRKQQLRKSSRKRRPAMR